MVSEVLKIETPKEDSHISSLLLKTYMVHPLCERLKRPESKSALELGCRFPLSFFPLFHRFDFTEFHGVDQDTKEQAMSKFLAQNKRLQAAEPQNFYEIYRSVFKKFGADSQPVLQDQQAFEALFEPNLNWETDVFDYMKALPADKKFDFISMINLLHLLPNVDKMWELINLALDHLAPDGVLYFRVFKSKNYNIREFLDQVQERLDKGSLLFYQPKEGLQYFKLLYY